MLRLDLAALSKAGNLPVNAWIGPESELWQGADVTLDGAARFTGLAHWLVGEEILVDAHLSGKRRGECRRCLETVSEDFDVPVTLYYVPSETALEVDADDVRVYDPAAREIDLGGDLREEVMLSLDGYLLCGADCKGMCARCGADLNRAECTCGPEEGDPRWDALKALKAK